MAFEKLGSRDNFEARSQKGGGQTFDDDVIYIRYIKDGMVVRFLENPDQWIEVVRHYVEEDKMSYTCTKPVSGNCVFCDDGYRKSRRFIANVLLIEEDGMRVAPLEIPVSLGDKIIAIWDVATTMTDRDYRFSKSGVGKNTTYGLKPGVPREIAGDHEPLDLIKILTDDVERGMRRRGEKIAERAEKSTQTASDFDLEGVSDLGPEEPPF